MYSYPKQYHCARYGDTHVGSHGPCRAHHRSHHRSLGGAEITISSAGARTPEVHGMRSGTGPGQIREGTAKGHLERSAARIAGGKKV
jgi:hypothetical protein